LTVAHDAALVMQSCGHWPLDNVVDTRPPDGSTVLGQTSRPCSAGGTPSSKGRGPTQTEWRSAWQRLPLRRIVPRA
jgi:hypothetical protein